MAILDYGSAVDFTVFVAAATMGLLLVLGILERRRHRRNIALLPLRISVNGSRGKSTVTRLLTGALAAGGMRALGKTTGTEARLVRGWDGTEIEVRRRPEGPNIIEQKLMMARGVAEGADTIVAECMAVNPEYQAAFHNQLLEANFLVVTNALDDHLEEMGPTADDVADVFASTTPRNGVVVALPGRHLQFYRRQARLRNAKLVTANPAEVDDEVLTLFDHLVFAEHVALVWACTRHFGISDDIALEGMLAAPADPFATRLLPIGEPDKPDLFVNAFPANDPTSTLVVFQHVLDRGWSQEGLVVIMNCRADRVPRSELFAREVLPKLPIHTLIVTGATTKPVTRAAADGTIAARVVHDLTGADAQRVINVLAGSPGNRIVLGVGNLHGGGAEVIAALQALAVSDADQIGVH